MGIRLGGILYTVIFYVFAAFLFYDVSLKWLDSVTGYIVNCVITYWVKGCARVNIIVLGNGFDLAHGLPTKYTDFLNFVEAIREALRDKKVHEENKVDSRIKNLIERKLGNDRDNLFSKERLWNELLDNNFWIDYFLQHDMHGDENWIDFESEISKVIQSYHSDMCGKSRLLGLYDECPDYFTNEYLENYCDENNFQNNKSLKDKINNDLINLIKALELYLLDYIGSLSCNIKSPDILDILDMNEETKVLNFNYTDTFARIYSPDNKEKYEINYIHGEAGNIEKTEENGKIEQNNMVLGIDEFLNEPEQRKYTELIEFKKFYQRIYKKTGCAYKEWVDEIQAEYLAYIELKAKEAKITGLDIQNFMQKILNRYLLDKNERKHNLYIFGHSIDVTDGDILKELILNNNVYTTIFYHDREAMGKQIANLVKIIGEAELIKRTGGVTKTIEFRNLKEMVH